VTQLGDVSAALRPWFAAKLDVGEVDITELRRHAEGWSWQTYTMSVVWRDARGVEQSRGYAVRREPEDGLLAPYDTSEQYKLHRAVLANSEVPMPVAHWMEPEVGILGMPFYVMDRVEGVVPVQWSGNDPKVFPDDRTRREIGINFVDVLTDIHKIELDVVGDVLDIPGSSDQAAVHQIDAWEAFYVDAQLVEIPLLRACIGWLRSNVATSGTVALVHGDYRIGNFMLGPDRRINAVFDWELAHVGDPVFDIAWAGMPLFRGRSPLWSQLLAPDEFLGRYEDRTDVHVDPEVLRFWTVFGHLRASAPHVRATRAFADGRAGDLRLAAMGHQNLYILKQLAAQLAWDIPTVAREASRPVDGSPLQVPLTRIFDGLSAALRDDVVPHVADPYAKAQVMAAIEVLANLATRVEWSAKDQMETILGARVVLDQAPDDAPAYPREVRDMALPSSDDAAAIGAARREHLAALAQLEGWMVSEPDQQDLSRSLVAFLLDDLSAELGRLRSGMYRSKKDDST
jgi:aminoglycoside phosphotransferase (APT) family kinase protein